MELRSKRRSETGFSLVELLVTVVIMAEILVGVAILFDSSNRLARSQTHLAALQQSLRVGQAEIVRYARMAGIGGLPVSRLNFDPDTTEPDGSNTNYSLLGAFPRSGYGVSVLNNVAAGENIVTVSHPTSTEDADGEVLENSDVLILRGVFSTPLYYVDPPVTITDPTAGSFPICITERIRIAGDSWEDYPQSLTPLSERLLEAKSTTVTEHKPVALILRDTLNPNAYGIVEFDHTGNSSVAGLTPGDCADATKPACNALATASVDTPQCIQFSVRLDPGSAPGDGYYNLSTGTLLEDGAGGVTVDFDPTPTDQVEFPSTAGSIGLLDEYRFFVRREYEVPGDATTRLAPVLSRALFMPGTDVQIDRVDVADHVIDLQIAIGVDSDGDGLVTEATDGSSDEVLYNHPSDTTNAVSPYGYRGPPPNLAPPNGAQTWYDVDEVEYHFLRISTLTQSRFPDLDHRSPTIGDIEDFNRGATITSGTVRYNDETQYHRRWLQTVVELRNML